MSDVLYYLSSLFSASLKSVLAKPNWPLIILVLLWVFVAVIQDFKKREVANWWNFSLIAVILVYRAFVAVSFNDLWYFLWAIIGLLIGFLLANIFYYARMFAGGDAKLLMALGAFLPLGSTWEVNLLIFVLFILLFVVAGSIYGLVYSLILVLINFRGFKSSFKKQFYKYKSQSLYFMLFFVILLVLSVWFKFELGIIFSLMFFFLPVLLLGAKSIEDSGLTKFVSVRDLTVGDWLTDSIKVGKKKIKPNWEGLSEEELDLINKKLSQNKKIEIKYGIPFTPAFLLGLLALFAIAYFI